VFAVLESETGQSVGFHRTGGNQGSDHPGGSASGSHPSAPDLDATSAAGWLTYAEHPRPLVWLKTADHNPCPTLSILAIGFRT
jgi:hypothetical protein